MGLVDPSALRLGRSRILEDISLLFGRIPEASVVDWRDAEFLGNSSYPGRYPLLSCVIIRNNKGNLEIVRLCELEGIG